MHELFALPRLVFVRPCSVYTYTMMMRGYSVKPPNVRAERVSSARARSALDPCSLRENGGENIPVLIWGEMRGLSPRKAQFKSLVTVAPATFLFT